ncbi:MAG: hypothetical protein NTU85_03185 [Candidatus Kaiserbacteria bacterium]|nr:hypothetical protein [Candidatus Kaiserbacteria bacterium]
MDPEIKKLLEETHALARENNRMLRAIRRSQWLGFIFKIIIWAIVLLLPLYLYQQYLQPIVKSFSSGTSTPSGPFGLPTSADIQKLINSYTASK